MAANRHVSGSLLPSNDPSILKRMETPFGPLQVFVVPQIDGHGLFHTNAYGDTLLATHGNGFSLHVLAKRMIARDEAGVRSQADYIQRCGGTTRHHDHLVEIMKPPAGRPRPGRAPK